MQFLARLLGLGPEATGADAELAVRLNRPLDGWQVFLIVVGVIAFAVWIYRKDGRATATPLFRTGLGVLRAALIVLVILMLTEPVLVATHVDSRRSSVAVLVDDSFSMDLAFADAEEKLRKQLQ
ncbi:MAG TPA: hypothetical protein VEJ63_19655, partial [Planctomycetota bacterium]|nr:hypothetical protein [Planctomycetota bacterium]